MTTVDLTRIISPGFTNDVLEEILRKKSNFINVAVHEINLSAVSNKGDSYLSVVTRFTVKASGNNGSEDVNKDFNVHLIVKSIPSVAARVKTFRSLDFFECEFSFFNMVWPALDAFQKSKNLKNIFDSIPLCLATFSDGMSDFIVFEDLTYQGYRAIERISGLDVETASVILKRFAHFHALSVAYRDQHPKEFEDMIKKLKETYFDEKFRKWYDGTLNKFFTVVKDAAEKELPTCYLDKLNEVTSQDVFGNISKLLKKQTGLMAITHGDCWVPNFLIKQTETVMKFVMIDFQLMRYTSLTTDILFILYTCLDPITRDQYWYFLIEEYYNSFKNAVEMLGSSVNVSLDALKEEMKMYGLFAFGMCNESLIMSLIDDEDVADLDQVTGDGEISLHDVWKINPIKDKKKRQRVANYLKHLIDNSFI